MIYKDYRISRGAKMRTGQQTWVAIKGNLALIELTEEALKQRIDSRATYDRISAQRQTVHQAS